MPYSLLKQSFKNVIITQYPIRCATRWLTLMSATFDIWNSAVVDQNNISVLFVLKLMKRFTWFHWTWWCSRFTLKKKHSPNICRLFSNTDVQDLFHFLQTFTSGRAMHLLAHFCTLLTSYIVLELPSSVFHLSAKRFSCRAKHACSFHTFSFTLTLPALYYM